MQRTLKIILWIILAICYIQCRKIEDNLQNTPTQQKHKVTTNMVASPGLTLTIKAPLVVYGYKTFTFSIIVHNVTKVTSPSFKIIDYFPSQIEYISSNPSGNFQSASKYLANITWNFSSLPAQGKIKIQVIAKAIRSGQVCNIVKLWNLSNSNPLIAKKNFKILGPSPGVHISTYDIGDPCQQGKLLTYVVEIINEGSSDATNIRLQNTIPREMVFIEAKSPVSYSKINNKIIFDPISVVRSGEKITYKIVCKGVHVGFTKNIATIQYDQFHKMIFDEESSTIYKP